MTTAGEHEDELRDRLLLKYSDGRWAEITADEVDLLRHDSERAVCGRDVAKAILAEILGHRPDLREES